MTTAIANAPNQPAPLTNATTDSKVIEMWLSDKSKNTQKAYRTTVNQFFELIGAGLNELTIDAIYQWRDYCLTRWSLSTSKNKLACIKSLIRYCSELNYIPFNLAKPVKLQKTKDTVSERILTKDEVQLLIESATSNRDKTLLKFIYKTGCRVSEAINLTTNDIRLHPCGSGYIVHLFGKGGKDRWVKIDNDLYLELMAIASKNYIFISKNNRQLSRVDAHRIIKNASKKAGIPKASVHWLRHSHCTHSLANGAPIHLVSASVGHSNIAVTGKYLHINPTEGSGDYL